MIIKGLFRRYERWNPVHPIYGAFWGMGVGVGCGIGWGPGFGPEAIGYVGAGCGVGFSVGITLAGFGIDLPANYVIDVPSTAIVSTGRAAASLAEFSGLRSAKDAGENGWKSFASRISAWQKENSGRFPGNGKKEDLDKGINVFDISKKLSADVRSLSKSFESFLSHPFHPGKGSSSGYGNT